MIVTYIDDSGSHHASDIAAYTALISTIEKWIPFDTAWRAKLKSPLENKPPLKRFHMAECEIGEGEFKHYSRPERDRVIHDFRKIILDSDIFGATTAIPVKRWNELVKKKGALWATADKESFTGVVLLILGIIRDNLSDREVELIFDRSPGREEYQKSIVDNCSVLFGNPLLHEFPLRIRGPNFQSSYDFTPLQAADMVAWESNLLARNIISGKTDKPRAHFAHLVDSHRFRGSLLDDKTMIDIVNNLKAI